MLYASKALITILLLSVLLHFSWGNDWNVLRSLRASVGWGHGPDDSLAPHEYTCVRNRHNIVLSNWLGKEIAFSVGKNGVIVQESVQRLQPAHKRSWGLYTKRTCHGLYGVYDLPSGYHLALIGNSESCVRSSLPGLRKVKKVELLRIPTTRSRNQYDSSVVAEQQEAAERLLRTAARQHDLYFTVGDYDVTRTYQSNVLDKNAPPDERFCWNLNVLRSLYEQNCSSFAIPVVNVWIGSTRLGSDSGSCNLTLISRRGRRRQGPRYVVVLTPDSVRQTFNLYSTHRTDT
jgi:hypothetical protein